MKGFNHKAGFKAVGILLAMCATAAAFGAVALAYPFVACGIAAAFAVGFVFFFFGL